MNKLFSVNFYTLKNRLNIEYYEKDSMNITATSWHEAKKAAKKILKKQDESFKLGKVKEVSMHP